MGEETNLAIEILRVWAIFSTLLFAFAAELVGKMVATGSLPKRIACMILCGPIIWLLLAAFALLFLWAWIMTVVEWFVYGDWWEGD